MSRFANSIATSLARPAASSLVNGPRSIAPPPPPAKMLEPSWLAIARTQLGVREVPGKRATGRITAYLHTCNNLKAGRQKYGADNDETAWCSAFVNWCLKSAGVGGTNHALAKSWVTWGFPLVQPLPGAVVVIRRSGGVADRATGSSTGNHVAFFLRQKGSTLTLLGGNQGDKVCEASFNLGAYGILATRWPFPTGDVVAAARSGIA